MKRIQHLSALNVLLATCLPANRWRAFVLRGPIWNVFCSEPEVVRAGFHRDWNAPPARIGEQWKSLRTRKMHDVDRCLKFFRQANQQINRLDLCFVRARSKIGGVLSPIQIGAID